jgi:hypothetical protein
MPAVDRKDARMSFAKNLSFQLTKPILSSPGLNIPSWLADIHINYHSLTKQNNYTGIPIEHVLL